MYGFAYIGVLVYIFILVVNSETSGKQIRYKFYVDMIEKSVNHINYVNSIKLVSKRIAPNMPDFYSDCLNEKHSWIDWFQSSDDGNV